MSVELRELIYDVEKSHLHLAAGEKGLANLVSWIHMVETAEASNFLEGGELIFTTGVGLHTPSQLMSLIQSVWEQQAAGIVFNIGPFLKQLPSEAVDFGSQNAFPIFTIPWETPLAHIMRTLSNRITQADQIRQQIADSFKNAIFFPLREDLYMLPLTENGFQMNRPYYVCTSKLTDKENIVVKPQRLETICTQLRNYMSHQHYNKFAMFYYENQLLTVFCDYEFQQMTEFVDTMTQYLHMTLARDEQFFLGIGKCTKSIRCLHKSYQQALSIQSLHEHNKIEKNLIYYENMGIYKLLMAIEDDEISQEYYENVLHPLIVYDEKNNSDLMDFLYCYLQHNGSVQETADILYVHRNTVNYKLGKISDILDADLSNLNVRLQLILGFMLKDML